MMNYDMAIRYRDDLNWAAIQTASGRHREKQAVGNFRDGANLCGRRV
jgi:hypothetical protein